MESLSDVLEKYKNRYSHLPDDVRYIPEDGLCLTCGRLINGHDGVEKVLSARGIRYWDEEKQERVTVGAIPICRCGAHAAAGAARHLDNANLPTTVQGPTPRSTLPASLENFDMREGNEAAHEMALDYSVGNTPPILMLCGGRGTGKTHLLEALGRSYLGQETSVRYELVPALLSRIRAGYSSVAAEDGEFMMQRCHMAQLLILDDLGAEKPSEWVREKLFELIDERYSHNRLLLVATNCSYDEMNESLGERIASRMFDDTTGKVARVIMTSSDYRRSNG